jgi:1-deoxy-D-xylulose-5-phosphate synthase
VAIRYPRGTAFCLGKAIEPFVPGKAEIISKGKDMAILSVGSAFHIAVDVVEMLKSKEHDPWLINVRTIKPLDTELLDMLGKSCQRIITIEPNVLTGGFGSTVRDYLSESKVKVTSFGYPDSFITQGKISELNELIGFTADDIFKRICDLS